MVDLHNATPETMWREKPVPSSWAPRFALVLAVGGAASYVVSMVLPYYVNDLDRFPLEDMPWGRDYTEMWPYDTAYSFPIGLAGIYAVTCAPLVAWALVLWAGCRLWIERRADTWLTRAVTLLAAAVSIGTLGWLTTPLASTLVSWWMD